jgi:hypothetical protein
MPRSEADRFGYRTASCHLRFRRYHYAVMGLITKCFDILQGLKPISVLVAVMRRSWRGP